ncbi:hypothetical protein NQ317_009086 [Molorchus minor]|uniref:Uncharacterized protein n=1 Tax=Molorchus minor TaxID=1323400 RepID=A0ABQ9JFP7_9CUCU|nr:hypothetical protein NQ317_009086 [Molorchus minor]
METATTPGAEGPPEETVRHFGCAHYKRKSKFVTPCCQKIYVCRFCHDEAEDHTVDRKEVTELVCAVCDTRQSVDRNCKNCGVLFGKYTCLECNLFDDEDKNQFHCNGCGICRIGGAERFFHCEKCNMCLPIQLKANGHKRTYTHRVSPVTFAVRSPLAQNLLRAAVHNDLFACPVCQTSLMNMEQLWKYWDNEVENTPMPPEYRNYFVDILCKDCHKEGTVKFHVVGLKCRHCGSYNTCRVKGPVVFRGYIRAGVRFVRYICSTLTFFTRMFLMNLPIFPTLVYDGFERNMQNLNLNQEQGEGSNESASNNEVRRPEN